MEVLFGKMLSNRPKKLDDLKHRKSDEAWGTLLVTRGPLAGKEIVFTCPFEIMRFLRPRALVALAGEWVEFRKRRTFNVCGGVKDASQQALFDDLVAVSEYTGLSLSKEEYDSCLEALGVPSLWVAQAALSRPGALDILAEKVGEDVARAFAAVASDLVADAEVAGLAELFVRAGTGLDLPHAARVARALRFRAARNGSTVTALVTECPWILAQVFGYDEGIRAGNDLAEYLKITDITAKIAGHAVAYVMEEARHGHSYARATQVYGRLTKRHGFPYTEVRRVLGLMQEDTAFTRRIGQLKKDGSYVDDVLADAGIDRESLDDRDRAREAAFYLPGVYWSEIAIAKKLNLVVMTPGEPIDSRALAQNMGTCAGEMGGELDEEQRTLARAVAENKVTVLVGEAGTGKTFAIKCLIQALHRMGVFKTPGYVPPVVSPTALAAYRAAEGTVSEEHAKTIHRFARFFLEDSDLAVEGSAWDFGRSGNLLGDFCVVMVDEASMLTPVMFAKLLHACPPRTRFVIAGDDGQLAPVGPGGVFPALIRLAREGFRGFGLVQLARNYRSGEGVIANASRVRRGLPLDFSLPGIEFRRADDPDAAVAECLAAVEGFVSQGEFLGDILVLAPTKSKGAGVDRLNPALQERFGKGDEIDGAGFRVGDPVVAVCNDYQSPDVHPRSKGHAGLRKIRPPERPNIFNGMRGVVAGPVPVNGESFVRVVFFLGRSRVETLYRPEEMRYYLSPAYCLTVHKAQGGQAKRVVLVLSTEGAMRHRSLLYTALTRCLKGGSVVVVAPGEFLAAPYAAAVPSDVAGDAEEALEGVSQHSVRSLLYYRVHDWWLRMGWHDDLDDEWIHPTV